MNVDRPGLGVRVRCYERAVSRIANADLCLGRYGVISVGNSVCTEQSRASRSGLAHTAVACEEGLLPRRDGDQAWRDEDGGGGRGDGGGVAGGGGGGGGGEGRGRGGGGRGPAGEVGRSEGVVIAEMSAAANLDLESGGGGVVRGKGCGQ